MDLAAALMKTMNKKKQPYRKKAKIFSSPTLDPYKSNQMSSPAAVPQLPCQPLLMQFNEMQCETKNINK